MFSRSQTDYLWFVDADMGFPRTALQQMLDAADPIERPVVGALAFVHRTEGYDEETNADLFGMLPSLALWHRDDAGEIEGFGFAVDYPRNVACKVDTTGAACLLIHRSVIEKMQAAYGDNWWTPIPHPTRNEFFGEDTSFFIRLTELDLPLFVHTGVRTSHDKGGIFLTEQAWDEQQRLRSENEDSAGRVEQLAA
jgi:hypothetical protein